MEKQLRGISGEFRVKAVLLIGDFGESEFLFNLLEAAIGKYNLKVLRDLGA